MRILCCGDRNWTDYARIARELSLFDSDTIIIEGCARGADSLAGLAAQTLNMRVEKYPANWTAYGKAAGPIRNLQMLREGNPDLVIAFHSNIESSKGTKNMINLAKKAGIEVRLIKD